MPPEFLFWGFSFIFKILLAWGGFLVPQKQGGERENKFRLTPCHGERPGRNTGLFYIFTPD
jgi:hypothetical protein